MTHYTFRGMDGYIGVSLLHVAPELPKMWYKMMPSKIEYLENVLQYAKEMNDILPYIKNGTANKQTADDTNMKYNDSVKTLRQDIFGDNYKSIELFSYELNIDKDAIRIRVNTDASRGEAEAFQALIYKSPGFISEDPDYNKNKYIETHKGGK